MPKVRVHTCFSIEIGDPLPSICACRRFITLHQAKRWVACGLADWVSVGKRTFHDKICIIGGSALRTPRGATIDRTHIERAFVQGKLEEVARIEAYGEINKEAIRALTVFVDPIKFDKDFREEWGRAILWTFGEDRTAGGIGKYNLDREKK